LRNGEKKADDYYSNLFPENTEVLVEVKNNGQIILQQKVILNSEGLKMDLTPKKEDEAIKTLLTPPSLQASKTFSVPRTFVFIVSAGFLIAI